MSNLEFDFDYRRKREKIIASGDPLKTLYDWVKTKHVNLKEFRLLLVDIESAEER